MKRPFFALMLFLAVGALALAAVLWMFGAHWLWVVFGVLLAVLFLAAAFGEPDEARGDTPVALLLDPMTGVPDFDGYRPRESELPQTQPAAELIQYEVSGESAEEILAQVMAAHDETKGADEHGSF